MTRRGTLAFAALGLAFALSACGAADDATEAGAGAGSPGEVVRAWATTQDVRLRCEQLVTARYVRTTYGSRQGCRKREAPSPQSRPLASRVRQSVLIRRARASADVEIKGGTLAGARGTIRLTRHGGMWRIDAVGTDFIRAVYAHSTFHQLQLTADEPGLRAGAARRCVDAKIGAHDERLVRAVWQGSEAAGETVVGEALFGCLNAPGTGARGASYLRARLITDVVDGEFGLTPAEEVCADRALRTKLSDREVLEHVRRDRSAPPPATARLAQLIADCKR